MPAEFFETLTFRDIEVGQKFICLPMPGDNNGHGGLKGAHYIFTKTSREIFYVGHNKRHPIGTAADSKGITHDFPRSMPVILLE